LSFVVGSLFAEGEAEVYGDFESGAIIMPKRLAASRR